MRKLFVCFLFTLLAGSLLTASACAPSKSSTPVSIATPSPQSKAMQDCVASLPHAGTQQKITLPHWTCEVASYDPQSNKNLYQWQQTQLSYRLGSDSGRVVLGLTIGIDWPTGMDAKVAKGLSLYLKNVCVPQINSVWDQSGINAKTLITLRAVSEEKSDDTTDDQVLHLALASDPADPTHPGLRVAQWPDRGIIYPLGSAVDESACQAQSKAGTTEICKTQAISKSSDPFCQALSRKVNEWLNVPNPDNAACGRVPGVNVAAAPSPEAHDGILAPSADLFEAVSLAGKASENAGKAAEKPQPQPGSGEGYWKTARVNTEDFKGVLAPVCKSLATQPLSVAKTK
jgi:hypothetical protein